MIRMTILSFSLIMALIPVKSPGQEKVQDSLISLQENLSIELNRTSFIPGEEVLISANCKIKGHNFSVSKVLYVELISPNNEAVIQEKIAMVNGQASAELYLPSNLSSGTYTLLAYTRWMKNFGESSYAQRRINVINPFIALPRNLFQDSLSTDSLYFEVFPEGGRFFEQKDQKVAYRIKNRFGEIVPCGIRVEDMESNVLLERATSQGYGSFSFSPIANTRYNVILTDALSNLHFSSFSVPELISATIQLKESDSQIIVSNLGTTRDLDIFVSNKGVTVFKSPLGDKLTLEKAELPKGLLSIHVLDIEKSIFSRSVFNTPSKTSVSVNMEKHNLNTREAINVSLKGEAPMPLTLTLRKIQNSDIKDNLVNSHFLGSHINELPEVWPSVNIIEEFLLLSNDFTNVEALESDALLPDMNGELVSGNIQSETGEIVANRKFFVTLSGNDFHLIPVQTDSIGDFNISINNQRFGENITFSNVDNVKIKMASPFIEKYDFIENEKLVMHDADYKKWLLEKAQQVQIKNLYEANTSIGQAHVKTVTGFSRKKDVAVYLLDEYNRFPTVADHIVEYIPNVLIRKEDGERVFTMRNVVNQSNVEAAILVTFNGMVWTAEQVLNYNPAHIEKIEVLQKQFKFGNVIYSGAVNFITYDDHIIDMRKVESCVTLPFQPLSGTKSKFSAKTLSERTPDMRVQLGWIPHLLLGDEITNFTFYASDIPGDYELVLTGVDESSYVYERIPFKVTSQARQ